jgi:hypothetical protein
VGRQAASSSKLYALSTGTFGGSPHFARLDAATGKSTILGALPSTTYGWLVGENDLYVPPGGGLLTVGASYQGSSTLSLALYR